MTNFDSDDKIMLISTIENAMVKICADGKRNMIERLIRNYDSTDFTMGYDIETVDKKYTVTLKIIEAGKND